MALKKIAANWIITEVLAYANKSNTQVKSFPVSPSDLSELLLNICSETISNKQGKDIFSRMWNNGEKANDIIKKEGLQQISNTSELNKTVDNVIKNNYKSVEEYQSGKEKLFGFFVGQIMKISDGKANPKLANEILKDKLSK